MNYEHLNCEERTMIQLSLEQGCTLRAIARSVQRSPSSISRELHRNGWSNPATAPRQRGRPPVAGGYRTARAKGRRCAGQNSATPIAPGPGWPGVGACRAPVAGAPFAGADRGHTATDAA